MSGSTRRWLSGFLAIVGLALVANFAAADESKASIGDKVEKLTFKDIRFLPRSLDDFPGKQAYVLVCMNTTCPVVQQYAPKLVRMEAEYRDKGVQFLALYTRAEDSILEIAEHSLSFDIPFPAVQDIDAGCVQALGVTRTPEVVVLDANRVLRYRGRIDDEYRTGGAQPTVTQNNLKDALDSVLAGQEVAVKETPVDGCKITPPRKIEANPNLTYAEHVQPVLAKHCVECHQSGTEAPFSLVTYDEVVDQGAMLAEVVAEQRMPPWYAGPSHGEFVNSRTLTTQERDTVVAWVAAGMPAGNLAPAPKESAEPKSPWLIGEPDKIINMFGKHKIQAEGYVAYKYVQLPYVIPHDTWVQGVQIMPTNTRVVHHCNLLAYTLNEKGEKDGWFITGKVPGAQPLNTAGTGIAVFLPKGTRLVFQIHYTTTGQEEECQIALGLKYYRGVVQKKMRNVLVADYKFAITPGDPHHKVVNSKTIDMDAVGIGLFSHMHVRGKDMSFIAHYPDGNTEHLLSVPNYSFDWQLGYEWEPQTKKFPKGTKLEVVAHYDNSTFNPYNPDPTATVKEGDQTYEEMLNGFFFYTAENENLNIKVDPETGAGTPIEETASVGAGE
jgi:hypothetical protein